MAINNDPSPAIFEAATYGIVGDLFKVVPMLIAKLIKLPQLDSKYVALLIIS